ncbi:GxGYxYP domain-containing protein [Microlunatus soli]|uniref:GxGYxY sequence motif-containing protein n=1 Tax=Microlunatus soli TaxID=630515 RepID=A0A1H1PAH0_9ACTN|nr:GxGYxYP domain-containing protein [Microlunatus soli]SDS07619.1 GxGYxY sequence motif-containing protein [Microlunatus soli]
MVSRRRFLATNATVLAGIALTAGSGSMIASTGTAAASPSGVQWQPGRLLPRFAVPGRLQAGSIAELPGEDQLLLTTLQGIVNRTRPELYFNYDKGDDTADLTWLQDFAGSRWHDDPRTLIDKYAARVAGAILYDPDVPDTINVATTLAGLRNAVVATAEQAETYGLKIVEDLRGRFTGQDKVAIYRWQLDNLWPHCEQRLLTGLPPTRTVAVDGVTWREVARETEQIRDSSNRTTLTLDVSAELGGEAVYVRFADAFGNDGWGASVASVKATADGTVIADFLPDTTEEEEFLFASTSSIGGEQNRFADGGNYWIYRFQPPAGTTELTVTVDIWNQYLITATDTAPTRVEPFPYFRDYVVATKAMLVWLDPNGAPGELLAEIFGSTASTTPYLGWFSNDVAGEWGGVDLAATKRVEVFAADFYANGTVHGGVPAKISSKINTPAPSKPANKIYLTLTFGEGDNIQYCQRHLRELWDNPDRGKVPTNWTISPVLADAGPAIYRYFQQTATDNDLLICGPSGAGYTYPVSWPDSKSLTEYADVTDRYLRETGLDLVYAYSNGDGSIPFTDEVLDIYRTHTGLRGIIQSSGRGGVVTGGELPVIRNFSPAGDAAEFKAGMDEYAAGWDGSAPFFIAGGVNAWNWTPTDVAELGALLADDDRYQVVLGDVFFDLLRQTDDPKPAPAAAATTRRASSSSTGVAVPPHR